MTKKYRIVVIVGFLVLMSMSIIANQNKILPPTIYVGCYEKSISETNAIVVFEVKNLSERIITFDENNFA